MACDKHAIFGQQRPLCGRTAVPSVTNLVVDSGALKGYDEDVYTIILPGQQSGLRSLPITAGSFFLFYTHF